MLSHAGHREDHAIGAVHQGREAFSLTLDALEDSVAVFENSNEM
jgi:hypothetical protein